MLQGLCLEEEMGTGTAGAAVQLLGRKKAVLVLCGGLLQRAACKEGSKRDVLERGS